LLLQVVEDLCESFEEVDSECLEMVLKRVSLRPNSSTLSPHNGFIGGGSLPYIGYKPNFATYMDPPPVSRGSKPDTRKRTDAVIYPASK
jgi:hypothetical protein